MIYLQACVVDPLASTLLQALMCRHQILVLHLQVLTRRPQIVILFPVHAGLEPFPFHPARPVADQAHFPVDQASSLVRPVPHHFACRVSR